MDFAYENINSPQNYLKPLVQISKNQNLKKNQNTFKIFFSIWQTKLNQFKNKWLVCKLVLIQLYILPSGKILDNLVLNNLLTGYKSEHYFLMTISYNKLFSQTSSSLEWLLKLGILSETASLQSCTHRCILC